MSKKKEKNDNQLWRTMPGKVDPVRKFKTLPRREQLARLYYWYIERKNNRKFFLRAIIRWGLVPEYLLNSRLA